MTTLKPIEKPAQAILARLEAMYAVVDPSDIDEITALWLELLDDDTLTQGETQDDDGSAYGRVGTADQTQ